MVTATTTTATRRSDVHLTTEEAIAEELRRCECNIKAPDYNRHLTRIHVLVLLRLRHHLRQRDEEQRNTEQEAWASAVRKAGA